MKKFKRSLKHSFGSRLMFLLELETSFKVVSSILNSRPVYARWGPRGGNDPDFLSPLTPNMMLTGRAGTGVPVRDYDLSDKIAVCGGVYCTVVGPVHGSELF